MKSNDIIPATIRGGVQVSGKLYHGRPCAKTFANRTQAQREAERVGGEVIHPGLGPVFFVRLPEPNYTVQHGENKACSQCLEPLPAGTSAVVSDGWLYCSERCARGGTDVSVGFEMPAPAEASQ